MRESIQDYGARAVLCLGTFLFVGVTSRWLTLESIAPLVGSLQVRSMAEAFFRVLGEPPPLEFEVWGARSMLVMTCVVAPLLLVSTRSRDTAHQGSVGVSPRLLALRVLGALLFLEGATLGAAGLFAQAHYGLMGDSPAMWPRFELCAHVAGRDHETAFARTDYYAPQPDGTLRFMFPRDAPIRELRVSGVRRPDASVELILSHDRSTAIRFQERECTTAVGDLKENEGRLLTRTGRFASGELHLDCPAHGVAVHVSTAPGASDQMLAKFGHDPSMRLVGRLLGHALCVLFAGLGLLVQGFGARTDPGTRDTRAQSILKVVPAGTLAILLLFTAPVAMSSAFGYDDTFIPTHVAGCVHIAGTKHPSRTEKPAHCSAGYRNGFDIVSLDFPHGSSLRALQIFLGREDDRAVEARFSGSPRLEFGRSQCEHYETSFETDSYSMGPRSGQPLSGEIHMYCPSIGFELHVSMKDC